MSADFWMGMAIGSIGSWCVLIVAAYSKSGTTKAQEVQNQILNDLMTERNELDGRKVQMLEIIAKAQGGSKS